MKKNTILRILLAAFLMPCVAGLITAGAVTEKNVTITVDADGSGEGVYPTVDAALAAASEMTWNEGDTLTVVIADDQSSSAQPLLFGAKTIWAGEKKLPITVKGKTGAEKLDLDSAIAKIACANDYTFQNLVFDIGDNGVHFYAGSGCVTFDGISFGKGTSARFFGDNFTAAAFDSAAGWALPAGEKHSTGLTFLNVEYATTSGNDDKVSPCGPNGDFDGGSKVNVYNVQSGVTCAVKPEMIHSYVVLDHSKVGRNVRLRECYGYSHDLDMTLEIKNHDNFESRIFCQAAKTAGETNLILRNVNHTRYINQVVRGAHYGDVNVTLENVSYANSPSKDFALMSSFNEEQSIINGDVNLKISGSTLGWVSVIRQQAASDPTRVGKVVGDIHIELGEGNKIDNIFPIYTGSLEGDLYTTISGGKYGSLEGCYENSTVRGNLYTTISGGTFSGEVSALRRGDMVGNHLLKITGGTFRGSVSAGARIEKMIGKATLHISGSPVFHGGVAAGAAKADGGSHFAFGNLELIVEGTPTFGPNAKLFTTSHSTTGNVNVLLAADITYPPLLISPYGDYRKEVEKYGKPAIEEAGGTSVGDLHLVISAGQVGDLVVKDNIVGKVLIEILPLTDVTIGSITKDERFTQYLSDPYYVQFSQGAGKIRLGADSVIELPVILYGTPTVEIYENLREDETYFTVCSGSSCHFVMAEGVTTKCYLDGGKLVCGEPPLFYGVNFNLSGDRLAANLFLSKSVVDERENFTLFATFKGKDLPLGNRVAVGEFYKISLGEFAASDFHETITFTVVGGEEENFDLLSVAAGAIEVFEEAGDQKMANLLRGVYAYGAESCLRYHENCNFTPDKTLYGTYVKDYSDRSFANRNTEGASYEVYGYALVLDNEVGFKFYSQSPVPASYEIYVNGERSLVPMKGETGAYASSFLVEIPASQMSGDFIVEVRVNGEVASVSRVSIPAACNYYLAGENAGLAMKDLAEAILVYLESVDEYFAAVEEGGTVSFDAKESDIAFINNAYTGTTLYFGDIHAHPLAGANEAAGVPNGDGHQLIEDWLPQMDALDVDFISIQTHRNTNQCDDPYYDPTRIILGCEPGAYLSESDYLGYLSGMFDYTTHHKSKEEMVAWLTEFESLYTYDSATGTFVNRYYTTRADFTEIINFIRQRGGFLSLVHPKSVVDYLVTDHNLDHYVCDYTGLEVFYGNCLSEYYIWNKQTADNYRLWLDLLAAGKRLWATAGSDSHREASNDGLTALYATEKMNTAYLNELNRGNFTAGPVGIKMAVGTTLMGGHTDFAGKRLVIAVDKFHSQYDTEGRTFRVDVHTDQGVVYSGEITPNELTYLAVDADESAAFYRVEIFDVTAGHPIALGNPIWND